MNRRSSPKTCLLRCFPTVSEAVDLLKELADDLQVYSMPDLIHYLEPGTRELMAFSIVAATASLQGVELPGMREYFQKNRIHLGH